MMIYFTGNLCLGHGNIIKYCNRPFLSQEDQDEFNRLDRNWGNEDPNDRWQISKDSIDAMDNKIIDNINNNVGKNDVLYVLGTFAHCPKNPDGRYYANCRRYRNMINCDNVNLIWGNDDYSIGNLFTECLDTQTLKFRGIRESIYLSHYPCVVWKKCHKGSIHLYSECHGNIEAIMDEFMPERRSMDVGIDNANNLVGEYRPFSLTEILDRMNQRKGDCIDPNPVD